MFGQNIQRYWAAVREQCAALPGPFYYVVSLEDPTRGLVGGAVIHVTREKAAQLIVDKSHRPAKAEEIDAHLRGEQVKREDYAEAERKRFMLNAPFMLNQQPQQPAKRGGKEGKE